MSLHLFKRRHSIYQLQVETVTCQADVPFLFAATASRVDRLWVTRPEKGGEEKTLQLSRDMIIKRKRPQQCVDRDSKAFEGGPQEKRKGAPLPVDLPSLTCGYACAATPPSPRGGIRLAVLC